MNRRYVLVRPESKLWIGWFNSWVHAYIHWRLKLNGDAAWFITRQTRYHKPRGWLKLDEPCALRKERAVKSPIPTRTRPANTRWSKRRYGRHTRAG